MTLERRTYLDWNATAPLRAEARSAMFAALDLVGNPSSVHAEGRAARRLVEDAREKVAALVGAQPREVYFTSGATEANNWVHRRTWRTVFYSRLEHPSVVAPVEAGDGERIAIAARRSGEIDLEALERELAVRASALADAPGQALLTLQTANNETGVVQPLADAVRLAKAHRVLVASDAVQAPGRIPVEFAGSGLAYLTLSAHKLGGPKGIGAVITRADAPLPPLLTGGGQERRHRAGTENVAAIAGFGAAAAEAMRDLAEAGRVAQLRDRLEQHVLAVARGAIVIGRGAPRLPNTSCLAVEGRSAETVVTALDLAGIAVSAGSACSSGKVAASPVLAAMGLEPGVARSAIRVSIGTSTTEDDIAAFAAAFEAITGRGAKAA
jgi:cysteine desulfurase